MLVTHSSTVSSLCERDLGVLLQHQKGATVSIPWSLCDTTPHMGPRATETHSLMFSRQKI